MQRFLITGVGGPIGGTFPPGSGEGAGDLAITSSFDVATVGHLFISSEFSLAPSGAEAPITTEFTINPTGEDLAIASSFTTEVV